MRKKIFSFLIILLFLLCILYGFQEQQKLPPPEKHEVEVRLVLVDVIVTKGGEFVTDLTKDDFELYEDGVKVPINSMDLIGFERGEFVTPEKEEIKTRALPQREKRVIVIFDSVNTIRRELERSKPQIIERLISLFKLGREIMVLELTDKEGMKLIQSFTRDPELLEKAVNKASGSIWVDKSVDELRKAEVIEDEAGLGKEGVARGYENKLAEFTGFAFDYFARIRFEKTINGLLALINTIKHYPGRKTILLISGGIPVTKNARIFDIFNLLGKQRFRRANEILEEVIHFANAHNITFYAVDPETYIKYLADLPGFAGGSLSFDPYDADIATKKIMEVHWMNMVAEGTGGVSLKGAKRFENFYQVVKKDLTYYYELSYYPKRKEADGEYHKIEVKVKRPGVRIRFRKGYSDYSKGQKEILLFASASYNPSIFKQIPFKAQAIPFAQDKDKFILWMNLALPLKELILERAEEIPSKILKLHTLVKALDGEKAFTGQINIPLNLTPSFLEFIKKTEYLGYNFRTPELKLKKNIYQAVFALYDDQTNKIGTWEAEISLPNYKKEERGFIINCVLGLLSPNPKKGKQSFSISQKDGSLEYGEIKFFPAVTNQFHRMQDASVFLQIFIPQGKIEIHPEFEISGEGRLAQRIPGKLIAESWNKKSKVWSGILNLNLRNVIFGDYTLKVEIPVSEEVPALSKEIKLTKLHY